MSKTELNISRRKLISSLCGFAPIYVLPIFIQQSEMSWWRYVIGLAVFIIAGAICSALFKRFVCPNDCNYNPISTTWKYLCYLIGFVFALVGILLFTFLPFGFVTNLVMSLFINLCLTLALCYLISK